MIPENQIPSISAICPRMLLDHFQAPWLSVCGLIPSKTPSEPFKLPADFHTLMGHRSTSVIRVQLALIPSWNRILRQVPSLSMTERSPYFGHVVSPHKWPFNKQRFLSASR